MDNDYSEVARLYMRQDLNWGSDLDVLKTSIHALRQRTMRVRYADIGCGQGFHLAMVKHIYPEVCATGIDACAAMLEQTKKLVQKMEADDVCLLQADISQFVAPLRYHVISFLNNGLGNVCPEKQEEWPSIRAKVMSNLRDMIEDGGHLILSVFTPEPAPVERDDMRLVHHDGHRYSVVITLPGGHTVAYHSHRFDEKEIVSLVEGSQFKVELFEKRMSRLVIRAKAV